MRVALDALYSGAGPSPTSWMARTGKNALRPPGSGRCRHTSVGTDATLYAACYRPVSIATLAKANLRLVSAPVFWWLKLQGDHMHKSFFALWGLAATAIALFISNGTAVAKTPVVTGPDAVDAAAQAVSPRVSDMGTVSAPGLEQKREKPLRLLPQATGPEQPDPVVQANAGPYVGTTTPIGYPGVGNGDYGFTPNAAPPDPNLAVGATQIVQWGNESFAVFDKSTGALLKGPGPGNTLFAALGGGWATSNEGDPIAQYDKIAN